MGLIDNKKKVFTTIGAYSSMKQTPKVPDETNLFPSINNKKDVVPYLLDTLKVAAGSFAVEQLVGQLFVDFVDKAEPELKKAIKNQTIQYNSGNIVPNTSFEVPVSQIDVYGKYKTNPDSDTGNLLYDNGEPPKFDTVAYQSILNDGTETEFGSNLLISYKSSTDSFNLRPNTTVNQNVGEWMNGFVDDMTIIDKKEFMSTVMDSFYGSITSNQNKTVEQIAQELEINKIIEQVINDDDSFEVLPEDYDEILLKAGELFNGIVLYDMGCGVMAANFPLSGMTNLISNISGSTDPNYISNEIGNTINESTNNQDITDNNITTIKDNFFQRIIIAITQKLAQAVTTMPQIRTILAISSAFQNNGEIKIQSIKESLKNFKVYIKCLVKMAMEIINKFIYDFVVGFLISLINPIIRKVIKEKINQFTGIIKSLVASKAPNTG